MICRPEGQGWRLITQPAHAWLSGEMAAAWGNGQFGRSSAFEAVILATRLHDIGWLAWDRVPRLDDGGRPVNFLAASLDDTLPMWRAAAQQVELIDPYAALLVSMHGSALFTSRLERGSNTARESQLIETMLADNEALRAGIRSGLVEHPLYSHVISRDGLQLAYRWLRVCDLLSLILCADDLPASGTIPSVPGREPGQRVSLNYSLLEPFTLGLEPWPFTEPLLALTIQSRYLDQTVFPDEEAFHLSLHEAEWTSHVVSLVQG